MNRKYPDNWDNRKPVENTTLQTDEKLRIVISYPLQRNGTTMAHATFYVIDKANTSIARQVINHVETSDPSDFCTGHGQFLAEYPIADGEELASELKEIGLQLGIMLSEDNSMSVGIDVTKPIIVINPPQSATKEELQKVFAEHQKDKQGEESIAVIKAILGIDQVTTTQTLSPAMKTFSTLPISPKANEATAKSPLAVAAEEMELIRKFGVKEMTKLAKKMNYHGEIINKLTSKKKAHA